MEDLELLSEILVQYKYSKKQLYKNVIHFYYSKQDIKLFDYWFIKTIEKKLIKVIFDLEMLFYEAENEILMRDGYLNGKISLNISNITKGKYKNNFYFSDLLKIKEELF